MLEIAEGSSQCQGEKAALRAFSRDLFPRGKGERAQEAIATLGAPSFLASCLHVPPALGPVGAAFVESRGTHQKSHITYRRSSGRARVS